MAFLLVVPISILGGIAAALRRGRFTDRAITIVGLSLTSIPEFVTAIVFIVVFGILLGWLPVSAAAPEGAGPLTQIQHLLLPSFALVAVLFGYIARIARAGVIEAIDADYTRTAYLKGLDTRRVIGRHILRNALLPTIAVIATQTGYLIGGLLVIEKLFNYNGIGQRIYVAAQNKDFPMLQSGVMIIGVVYLAATLFADILYSLLNPRIRFGGDGMSIAATAGRASPRRRSPAGRRSGSSLRSKTFLIGAVVVLFWVFWALVGSALTPHDPIEQTDAILKGPSGTYLFGTDQLGRDVLSRVLAGATDTLKIAPLATLLGIAGGTAIGLVSGYFLGVVDEVIGRIIDAVLSLPLIVIAVTALFALGSSTWTLIVVIGGVFMPIVSRTVRATVLAERQLEYVQAARLRGERAPYVMFVEILPNAMGPIIVEATVRLGYAIFAVAGLTFLGFGVQPPSPDWSLQIADNYTLLSAGNYEWTVLFPGRRSRASSSPST